MIKAALFDLDGVVLDTESQYTGFWGSQFRRYYPEEPGLEHKIKGMTLDQIYNAYYAGRPDIQETITRELDAFEQQMEYAYIPGFRERVAELRRRGVKTAVVTSSNRAKMKVVYGKCPELSGYFDRILTSEDFSRSKPHPDCYLQGAAALGVTPADCVAFEDSVNGLRSVRAAGIYCVALTTTNPREVVAPLADRIIGDFTELSIDSLGDFPRE